ncbi:MAG: hypothetical protein RMK57_01560 [Bryobacterales bacterium]|nr:hypothetical protein [Bryobacteraceae bacterium]MDW8353191.1 hypothetical protein [Bryobacterales bacterium]
MSTILVAGSLLCWLAGFSPPDVAADPAGAFAVAPQEIITRYLEATARQRERFHSMAMEVSIDARLPRLKKEGTLQAWRHVTSLGRITYDAVRFAGDKMIRNDVIARYLRAEAEAAGANGFRNGKIQAESLAVTPANYKFKFKGMAQHTRGPAYVFEVSPRKKQIGLFKGELWIDAERYLPVREWGVLVKNPSIFLKRVEFVRDYVIRDDLAVPRRILSTIHTRIVGPAELAIEFGNVTVERRANVLVSPAGW